MATLNRNYELTISLKDGRISKKGNFEIYQTDANILNFYIILKDVGGVIVPNADLSNYEIKMYVVRPDLAYKVVDAQIDGAKDRVVVDIGADVVGTVGTYKFELRVKKDDEILTTNDDKFTVRKSITEGLVQATSLSIASLKELSPSMGIDELKESKIDDVKFDGKVMTFYANEKVVRKVYFKEGK